MFSAISPLGPVVRFPERTPAAAKIELIAPAEKNSREGI